MNVNASICIVLQLLTALSPNCKTNIP